MSIRTSSLFIVLLICGVSCTTVSKRLGPVTINQGKANVVAFLSVSPETRVLATRLNDNHGDYLLIYSEDFKKGVVLDVEKNTTDGHMNVRNIGFGTRSGNGQWNLYNEDKNGVRFESQGGEWTLQHFATLLTRGLKQKSQPIPFKDLIRE